MTPTEREELLAELPQMWHLELGELVKRDCVPFEDAADAMREGIKVGEA